MYWPGRLTWYWSVTAPMPSVSVTLAVMVTGWLAAGWVGELSTWRTIGGGLAVKTPALTAPGVGSALRHAPPRSLSVVPLISWMDGPVPSTVSGSPTVGQGKPAP